MSAASHELAALALKGQSFIEADHMPAGTLPRVALEGELPPAISMISFEVDRLPESEYLRWLAPPAVLTGEPYQGRRAGVCLGSAGEWIELIERS